MDCTDSHSFSSQLASSFMRRPYIAQRSFSCTAAYYTRTNTHNRAAVARADTSQSKSKRRYAHSSIRVRLHNAQMLRSPRHEMYPRHVCQHEQVARPVLHTPPLGPTPPNLVILPQSRWMPRDNDVTRCHDLGIAGLHDSFRSL